MEAYRNEALKYVDSVKSSTQKIDGLTLFEYGFEKFMILEVAKRYILPPAISELLRVGDIIKPYGNPLRLKLSTNICWLGDCNFYRIYSKPCTSCGLLTACGLKIWTLGNNELCERCHVRAHDNWEYKSCMVMINLLDWVEFMTEPDIQSKFYVNCNPESYRYGEVIYCYPNRERGFGPTNLVFRELGHSDDLIGRIMSWLNHIPLDFNHNLYIENCIEFLNSKSTYAKYFKGCSSNLTNTFFLNGGDPVMDVVTTTESDGIKGMAVRSAHSGIVKHIRYKDLGYKSFTNYCLD